jgi:hypothetical protein
MQKRDCEEQIFFSQSLFVYEEISPVMKNGFAEKSFTGDKYSAV